MDSTGVLRTGCFCALRRTVRPQKVKNMAPWDPTHYSQGVTSLTGQDLSGQIAASSNFRNVTNPYSMEGHRWFDLCRWGVAKQVMDAYKAGETAEAQSHMATFILGKHELFPIPSKEIDLNPMDQNPLYE